MSFVLLYDYSAPLQCLSWSLLITRPPLCAQGVTKFAGQRNVCTIFTLSSETFATHDEAAVHISH